jgi:SEC-C motif
MALFHQPTGLGDQLTDELPVSEWCLEELRKLQEQISKLHKKPYELFDFGLLEDHLESEKTIEGKLDRLTRVCAWNALALKAEFKLKLLYTIDGYLSAVDAKNPVSTFLLARYLLELVATVSAIDIGFQNVSYVNFRDWLKRGRGFIAMLYRARHSTSDEKFKSISVGKSKSIVITERGISAVLVQPIRISTAIRGLTSRPGFESAVSTYDSLFNMCHHNGSGHKMLAENIRETDMVVGPNGAAFLMRGKVAAMTLAYPASHFASQSLARTARVAWWSAHCANKMIDKLPIGPFSIKELSTLTDRRLTSVQLSDWDQMAKARKIGRNDPCPCGSGKKYKGCCGRQGKLDEALKSYGGSLFRS